VLNLVKRFKVVPMSVSQQVLAVHPVSGELRTGTLLTTYGDKFHVQFHKTELGVCLMQDNKFIPISRSQLFCRMLAPSEALAHQQRQGHARSTDYLFADGPQH